MRLLVLALFAACAAEAPPPAAAPDAPRVPPAPPAPSGPPPERIVTETPCGAEDYAAGLFGANIAAVTLPADLDHRVIYPDQVVTQDHVPTRLNIHVDEAGTVLRFSCG